MNKVLNWQRGRLMGPALIIAGVGAACLIMGEHELKPLAAGEMSSLTGGVCYDGQWSTEACSTSKSVCINNTACEDSQSTYYHYTGREGWGLVESTTWDNIFWNDGPTFVCAEKEGFEYTGCDGNSDGCGDVTTNWIFDNMDWWWCE